MNSPNRFSKIINTAKVLYGKAPPSPTSPTIIKIENIYDINNTKCRPTLRKQIILTLPERIVKLQSEDGSK